MRLMSVSMYTNRVNSLTSDLSRLHSKLAGERKKWADANAKVHRAADAAAKASSISQMNSRARDLERAQRAVADADRKVADVSKQIAQKQKDLSSAQANLARAEREQQKKDDRDAERRRKADLDHVKKLERDRRALADSSLERLVPGPPRPRRVPVSSQRFNDTYDVALSFAGEQRDYVEMVAAELKAAGLRVFYDQDDEIIPKLWGKDLGEYLDYIYREGSRYCVMFISADYAAKAWTRHERRSALARSLEDGSDYVLPARFDDTDLPGLRPTTGYLDLSQYAPATLAEFVVAKLRGDSAARCAALIDI